MKKIHLARYLLCAFYILLLLVQTNLFAQNKPKYDLAKFKHSDANSYSGSLFVIKVNSKYGFIGKNGDIIIEPEFDEAQDFDEGFAPVRYSNKWGFINTKGKITINPEFDEVKPIRGGIAPFRIGNKWGIVGINGKIIHKPQFSEIADYSEGIAVVKFTSDNKEGFPDNLFGYIDKSGAVIIRPQFASASKFKEGLAAVSLNFEKFGFIDITGKFIINPKFSAASNFSEGIAQVALGDSAGYIDKTGKFVIQPQFWVGGGTCDFQEGFAQVRIQRTNSDGTNIDRTGFIDKQGKWLVQPQYGYTGSTGFSEGLAAVYIYEKGVGFIDKTGKIVIKPQFVSDAIGNVCGNGYRFSEGLVLVNTLEKENWKSFFINKTGAKVSDVYNCGYLMPFKNSLAKYYQTQSDSQEGESWGYIDKSNKIIWKATN